MSAEGTLMEPIVERSQASGPADVRLVSVIVPVRNGEAHLPGLLAALQGQDVAGGLEIVAVDSGSRDGGPPPGHRAEPR